MVTPELMNYIRAEFAKGKTQEEIRTALLKGGGGWTHDDLQDAFSSIIPPQQSLSPNAEIPQATFQTAIPSSNVADPAKDKKLFWIGVLAIAMSYLVIYGSFLTKLGVLNQIFSQKGFVIFAVVGVAIGGFVISLLQVFIFHKLTKLFKAPVRSWRRATFVFGCILLIGALLISVSIYFTNISQLLRILLIFVAFIVETMVVSKFHQLRFGRSLILIIVNAVVNLIGVLVVIAVIGTGAGAMLAALQTARQKASGVQPLSQQQSLDQAASSHDTALAEQYEQKGKADGQNKKYAQAIEDFTKAINAVPDTTNAEHKTLLANIYLGRSFAKSSSGDIAGAIVDVTTAIGFDATNKLAYFSRASFYMQQNDILKTSADFNAILALDPTNKDQPDNDNIYLLQALVAMKNSHNQTLACADFHKITDPNHLVPEYMDIYKAFVATCK